MNLATPFASFGDQDYGWFATKVQQRFDVKLTDYKPDQMKRRLASLAQRNGMGSFVEYFGILEKDNSKLAQFLDEMTINVTELLRNPNLFATLLDEILPGRFPRKDGQEFRVWSAGCSYGAEAYTLAMLLYEKAPTAPFKVLGSDIDLSVLARANNPRFSKEDVANLSDTQKKKHFITVDDCTYFPQNHLRDRVHFSPHDLLGSQYSRSHHDLILCRNVLIYFTDDAKEKIYRNMCQSLKPGGVLFVGGTERLSDHAKSGFTLLRPFFYEKPIEPLLKAA